MSTLLQDVRYGIRMLRKAPGFTVVAVLTLALGIAANTAVFSVINAFFLRWLPFEDPQQLVHIWATSPQQGSELRASEANFLDWRERARSFDQLGAYYYSTVTVTTDEEPVRLQIGKVTSNLPALLGVQPILGRGFSAEEEQPGRSHVVLLSYTYWQRQFNSTRDLAGKTVRVNGENYAVIGVMPASFVFPLKATQMWTPLPVTRDEAQRGAAGPLLVVGRLKAGATVQSAQAEMNNISRALATEYPADKDAGARIIPIAEALLFFHDEFRLLMAALLVATGFVLLIVCTNLGNLMVARAIGRSREVAIRTALGASRARLLRQLITESALLAVVGGALGVWLASAASMLLDSSIPPDLYRVGQIGIDVRVLAFTAVMSLLAIGFFGLAPALLISRPHVTEALKDGGHTSTGVRSRRLRDVLVVAQIALAMVLIAGAIFSAHAFLNQRQVDPGFNPSNLLTAELGLPQAEYSSDEKVTQFFDQVLQRLQRLPGVSSAATTVGLPMNFELYSQDYRLEAATAGAQPKLSASRFIVTPDYFRTMQIPVLAGSAFSEAHTAKTPRVVLVNHVLANQNWPNESPIGKQIRLLDGEKAGPLAAVIGVVGDSKDFLMTDALRPQIFLSQLQQPTLRRFLVIRAAADPLPLVPAVRREIGLVDKNVPLTEIRRMDRVVFEAMSPFVFAAAILGLLGAGAVLLAAMGIYGVLAYSVRQRTQEIGVRMALGARRTQIVTLILRQGACLAAIGLGIGLAGTLALMQLAHASLPGAAFDPVVIVGTPVLLGAMALLACFVPARRASRVDPIVALRYE